jgi:farnesyl diphosphate synthase
MATHPKLAAFEQALEHNLKKATEETHAKKLVQAIEHMLFPGGKRFRPQLIFALGSLLHVPEAQSTPCAIALEYIHTYSLIHDDLPAMDNDALRRGKPTCHIAFDEATAILAGDALQGLAYQALAESPALTDPQKVGLICLLSKAAGPIGMVDGQMEDINPHRQPQDQTRINQRKTGCLIEACANMVCLLSGNPKNHVAEDIKHYGEEAGLLFQCHDDLLDADQLSPEDAHNACLKALNRLNAIAQKRQGTSSLFDTFHAHWTQTIQHDLKTTASCL